MADWCIVSSAAGATLDAPASSGVCEAGDGVIVSGGVGGRRTDFLTWKESDTLVEVAGHNHDLFLDHVVYEAYH